MPGSPIWEVWRAGVRAVVAGALGIWCVFKIVDTLTWKPDIVNI